MCANRKRHPPAARNFLGFSQHRDQIDRSARARDAQPQHCSVVRGCSQHRDQINPPKLAMHNHQKGFAKAIRLRDADPDLQVMTWVGMGRNGMERNGMEWNGMEWNARTRTCIRVRCRGVRCHGAVAVVVAVARFGRFPCARPADDTSRAQRAAGRSVSTTV